jgi:hypothetical protein
MPLLPYNNYPKSNYCDKHRHQYIVYCKDCYNEKQKADLDKKHNDFQKLLDSIPFNDKES